MSDVKDEKLLQEYTTFCEELDIKDISITEMKFKKYNDPDPQKYKYIYVGLKTGKTNFEHGDEDTIEINQNFNFYINESMNNDNKDKDNDKTNKSDKRKIYEQKITMKIVLVNSEMDMNEDIFKHFKDKNLPLITQPFLREVINNSMYRAGVPPFNIPLINGKY